MGLSTMLGAQPSPGTAGDPAMPTSHPLPSVFPPRASFFFVPLLCARQERQARGASVPWAREYEFKWC